MKCYIFHHRVLPTVSMSWNNCAKLWERTGEKHSEKINCCEYPVVNHHSLRCLLSQQLPRHNAVWSMLHTACTNEIMGFQSAASKTVSDPWSDFKMSRKGDYRSKLLYYLYRLEREVFGPQLLEIEILWAKSLNRLMGVITTITRNGLWPHKTSTNNWAIRGPLSLSAANFKPEPEKLL